MADIAVKYGLASGVALPKIMSGAGISPDYALQHVSNPLTTTATRLYYVPIYLDAITTFAGFKTYNSGAGDSGDVYRVGIYGEATAGGPGALLNDCGEVTLTGAAALRTSASSFSNTSIGWHYLAFHAQDAAAMYSMSGRLGLSGVGLVNGAKTDALPQIGIPIVAAAANDSFPFLYVDTTYGALASTAVAPTASTQKVPIMQVYV